MRTITVEEHFAPPGFLDGPGKDLKESFLRFGARGQKLIAQIEDLGAGARRRDGCRRHRHAGAVDQCAGRRAARRRHGAVDRARLQRRAGRSGEEISDALCRPCRARHHGAGQGRRRVRTHRAPARLQGRADQRPFARPLSRRQVLLADPRMRGKARRADLPAPDAAAAGRGRRDLQRLFQGSELRVVGVRLGLAHRDRDPCHPHGARRRVRPLSEIADRDRPSRRRPAVHACRGSTAIFRRR